MPSRSRTQRASSTYGLTATEIMSGRSGESESMGRCGRARGAPLGDLATTLHARPAGNGASPSGPQRDSPAENPSVSHLAHRARHDLRGDLEALDVEVDPVRLAHAHVLA